MRCTFDCIIFVFFVCFVVSSPAADPTYWQDVRPALRKSCTVCHNKRNLAEADISGGLALDNYDPTGPFGAKGVGEPTCVSTAAAILNAIHDAVGVRITSLPATAEKVHNAIKAKQAEQSRQIAAAG